MNDFRLYAALQELQNCTAQYADGEARTAEIRKIMDLIATQQYHVAVIGEFNRGKSSLINALLGTRILPTDILPMTAAVTKLRYGVSQQIRILFRDATDQICTLEALEQYATKRTADSERQAAAVREIEISWPSVFLQNHIELTDTPGLNESERMSELTMQAIGDVDAAIVVFSPDSPLSLTEQGLILDLLRQPGIRHLVFVMNMLDRVRTEQRKDRLLENIRTRLQQELLPRALEDTCIDPDKAHRILDSPAVFGVSALQALEGFSRDDPELVAASRFPDFKTQLLALLTAARGMDPQARGNAAVRAVCRDLPAWQAAAQAALCAEIQSLEAQLAACRQPSAETALPPAACRQLRTQAGLTENGLDLEQRLLPKLQRVFIQELQTVTLQNNTDAVIRSCLQRAELSVSSSMQGNRNVLERKITRILQETAAEPVLSSLTEGEEAASVQAQLQAHLQTFPQFCWTQSPIPEGGNLVGRELMPQIRQALMESLHDFDLQVRAWTLAYGRILSDSRCRQAGSPAGEAPAQRLSALQEQLRRLQARSAEQLAAMQAMAALFEQADFG